MGCTSPLYRVPIGSSNWYKLTEKDRGRLRNHGVIFKYADLDVYRDYPGFNMDDVQVLRCGQCTDCRLASSRDWAIRCSLEAEMHEFNYFITLTYDNLNIPRGEFIDFKGDLYDSNLCRRDVQLFIKSYREWERTQNNNIGIKVFYCGEYGDLNGRPHYHLCVFGSSEIPDLQFSFKRGSYDYYKSKKIESFWSSILTCEDCSVKVLRGFVDITDLSFDSAAYTARYVMKKQKGKIASDFKEYYETLDPSERPELRLQPFIGMSLKPGIASEYYEKHKFQIREEDLVKYHKKYELFKSKPPRYFDRLFDREDHEGFLKLSRKRKLAGIAARSLKRSLTSEDDLSRMQREERMLQERMKKYVRDL